MPRWRWKKNKREQKSLYLYKVKGIKIKFKEGKNNQWNIYIKQEKKIKNNCFF